MTEDTTSLNARHREVKLKLSCKSPTGWLAFIVPDDAGQATGGQGTSGLSLCELYKLECICQEDVPIAETVAQLLGG